MIKAIAIDREIFDARTSGRGRQRVDAYFVEYQCPADAVNAETHTWICRFEVPRGTPFKMSDFANKDAARAARGFTA
jgi:hypothetical protein